MRCLWPSENQRNWIFDIIYWTLRHNQNHPNWNLGNIFAWKTTFFYGLRYFIHFWKSFCLKLALNLSNPQTPHITTIFEIFLQIILFYVKKSACHILGTIGDTGKFTRKGPFVGTNSILTLDILLTATKRKIYWLRFSFSYNFQLCRE